MKALFKYILLMLLLTYMVSPIYSQRRQKKTVKKSINKKSKKKTTKKINKKKKTSQKTYKIAQKEEINDAVEPNTVKVDSIPEKVVTILSEFKPQLKYVAKIGFVTATAQNDTSSLQIVYNVPSQNLSFEYRPISLIPRAYKIDSTLKLKNNGSIKAGYGNYFQYLIDAKYNLMDANSNIHALNIYNESVKGLHHLQSQQILGFNYLGAITIDKNNQLNTQLFYKQSGTYRYGLVPDSSILPNDNFKQSYSHYGVSLGWDNSNSDNSKFTYKPIFKFEHFDGIENAKNNNIDFQTALGYALKNDMRLNMNFSYNFNQFNTSTTSSITNSILKFETYLQLNKLASNFNVGVSPIIDNNKFNLFPLITFKKRLSDTNFVLSAHWNTNVSNNQYSTLVMANPWISVPTQMESTTQDKKQIAIDINANKRLNYGFALSFNSYKNIPLFNRSLNTNYLQTGLFYNTIFEKKASTIEFDANLRYQFSDQLLVKNTLKYIQFNTLQDNAKPWGILPLTLESNVNWMVNPKISMDGNLKYWSGATISNQQNIATNLNNSLILSAGFNYKISSQWTAWLKGENLLDKPYQRWADYPSLGIQLMGGIVYSFR